MNNFGADPLYSDNLIIPADPFKPDLITCWPRNCDYPIWRYFIHTHRKKFSKIIIAFMDTQDSFDYRDFVRFAMANDEPTIIEPDPVASGEDWRNVQTNKALTYSDNEWVWFTEEDFIATSGVFWEEIYYKVEMDFDLIGITQGGRLHPASIFCRRSVIDSTRRDFSVIPGIGDHFIKFQQDVEKMNIKRAYLANEEVYQYKHFNGFSHNWRLVQEGGYPVYHPEEFIQALRFSLDIEKVIGLDQRYKKIVVDFLSSIGKI